MTSKEHKEYLDALRKYSNELLKSEDNVKGFLRDAGIHTQTGRLTKNYSSSEPIGYKNQNSKEGKK